MLFALMGITLKWALLWSDWDYLKLSNCCHPNHMKVIYRLVEQQSNDIHKCVISDFKCKVARQHRCRVIGQFLWESSASSFSWLLPWLWTWTINRVDCACPNQLLIHFYRFWWVLLKMFLFTMKSTDVHIIKYE